MDTLTKPLTFIVASPEPAEAAALANVACIVVAQLCGLPVQHITVLERVGRAVLVDYTCHGGSDPIIPVVLAQMPAGYQQAWQAFAAHLERWTPYWQYAIEQRQWFSRANTLLGRLLIELGRVGDLLSQDELAYLHYQFHLCIASPNRKHQEAPEFYG